MKKKIVGILVCTLLIATALSAAQPESTIDTERSSMDLVNGLTFGQVDFFFANDSAENSAWGHVEVDVAVLTEQYEKGFLNIYTDAGWVVQNEFIDNVEVMESLAMYFDLGVPPGEDVEYLSAYTEFTPEPYVEFDDGPREEYIVETLVYNAEGAGMAYVPEYWEQMPFDPAGDTYDYIKPNLYPNENVQAACCQCFPMAIANSLQYLENRNPSFIIPHDHVPGLKGDNSLVGQLDTYCGRYAPSRTVGGGVWFVPMIKGKFQYLADNGLAGSIIHKHQGYGYGGLGNQLPPGDFTHAGITSKDESVGGQVTFDWIEEQLRSCEDVEITNYGHAVRVFGCGKTLGKPWLRYKHDRLQTNYDPTDTLGLQAVQIYVDDTDGDGMMNFGSSSNEITFSLEESVGVPYNSTGPGIIIAFGQGTVTPATGQYNFNYGLLRFIGFTLLGGGPSFHHTSPAFTWTQGQYTPGRFIGICLPIGSYILIFGFLRFRGTIIGVSYP